MIDLEKYEEIKPTNIMLLKVWWSIAWRGVGMMGIVGVILYLLSLVRIFEYIEHYINSYIMVLVMMLFVFISLTLLVSIAIYCVFNKKQFKSFVVRIVPKSHEKIIKKIYFVKIAFNFILINILFEISSKIIGKILPVSWNIMVENDNILYDLSTIIYFLMMAIMGGIFNIWLTFVKKSYDEFNIVWKKIN